MYVCISLYVCLSVVCLSSQERGYGQENASPIPFNFSEGGGEDRSRRLTNMPPPKTKKLLNPRARPSGLQRPLQRGGGTRVLGVRPNGCKRTEGPMKARVRCGKPILFGSAHSKLLSTCDSFGWPG